MIASPRFIRAPPAASPQRLVNDANKNTVSPSGQLLPCRGRDASRVASVHPVRFEQRSFAVQLFRSPRATLCKPPCVLQPWKQTASAWRWRRQTLWIRCSSFTQHWRAERSSCGNSYATTTNIERCGVIPLQPATGKAARFHGCIEWKMVPCLFFFSFFFCQRWVADIPKRSVEVWGPL